VVIVIKDPPAGPLWEPMACRRRQGIAPVFGQLLGSDPAETAATLLPQTALLSNELCHVGLPNGSGDGATELGFGSGLKKCVRICWLMGPILMNNVACGLDETTVQEAPDPDGRQI
jgi:hypothetical protein